MRTFLRTFVSLPCFALCVALIVFWIRSYRATELVVGPLNSTSSFVIYSVLGRLIVSAPIDPPSYFAGPFHVGSVSHDDEPLEQYDFSHEMLGFNFLADRDGMEATVPYWFPVLLTGSLAAVPWLKRPLKFSLRALLIVMTLAALGLGIVAVFG